MAGDISTPKQSLAVAAAQPAVAAGNVQETVAAHAALVLEARARLVVFPELSLTGYELGAPTIQPSDPRLQPLIDACRAAGTTALVGAPIAEHEAEFIAAIAIDGTGASTVYRKVHLGAAEVGRFSRGPGAASIQVDGWRVGIGICKDTGVAEHVQAVAALELDLYVAGVVHLPDEAREQERRARHIARATRAPVALASFAGPTGGGYHATAGCSGIWSSAGNPITIVGSEAGMFAGATIAAAP